MTDLSTLLIAFAAAAGSIAAGLMGWLDAGGPWSWRKFGRNVLRSITTGMTAALGQEILRYSGIALYFVAFLSGAGLDTLLNRSQSSLNKNGEVTFEDLERIARYLDKSTKSRTKEDQTHAGTYDASTGSTNRRTNS